jgi:cation diffusion facilitator CzcD-associated flavoprotein CzcO
VGGIWDIDAPGTPMYESAHFISSKTLSAFRDLPMPESYPDYPSHRQVLAYLRAYADRHGVRERTDFGVRREAGPAGRDGPGWIVRRVDGREPALRGVILATGLQWTPKRPELPGRFDGEEIHSSDYRSPRQVQGRRALVVGGGNSGCDIAVDVSSAASRTCISLRRGYWFIPKHLFGMPADVFGHKGPQLPGWLEQPVFERMLRLLVGDVRRFGLPAPDHRLFETHPVLNTQILHALGHGDLSVKPDVRELAGDRVAFADGSEEPFDLIIYATGYRRVVPVLAPDIHREGDVSSLFLNLFHRRLPDALRPRLLRDRRRGLPAARPAGGAGGPGPRGATREAGRAGALRAAPGGRRSGLQRGRAVPRRRPDAQLRAQRTLRPLPGARDRRSRLRRRPRESAPARSTGTRPTGRRRRLS